MRTVSTSITPNVVAGTLWRWWSTQLSGLVPTWLSQAFAKRERRIVLASDEGGANGSFRLLSENVRGGRVTRSRRHGSGALSITELTPQLLTLRQATPLVKMQVRLRHDECLSRTITVPWTAQTRLTDILNLDIERVTPFRRQEVYSAHLVASGSRSDDRLEAEQLIVERSRIDPIVAALREQGIQVDGVDCWNRGGTAPLAINLLQRAGATASRGGGSALTAVLALALLLLGGATVWLDFDRYDRAQGEIDAKLKDARKELAGLRKSRAEQDGLRAAAERLIARKAEQRATVVVVDDLARRMPDDSWLSSLHIEGHTVDMFGFSKSATSLVQVLQGADAVRRFSEVRLTAPITYDTNRKAEQFSLRLTAGVEAASGPLVHISMAPVDAKVAE